MVITLVEKSIAKIGYTFTHVGETQICEICLLRHVCVNSLEKNKSYIIKSIMGKEHTCLIDDSKMIVCNVEEANYKITIQNTKFLDNIVVKRESINCKEIICEYYENCLHPNFEDQTKIKIIRKIKEIKCPLDFNLILIEARKIKE